MVILNKMVHERARLLILTNLATSDGQELSFSGLKENLGLTSGNLSVQLNRLQQAGYLKIRKMFENNRPLTTVALTVKGHSALNEYLQTMETIITRVKDSENG